MGKLLIIACVLFALTFVKTKKLRRELRYDKREVMSRMMDEYYNYLQHKRTSKVKTLSVNLRPGEGIKCPSDSGANICFRGCRNERNQDKSSKPFFRYYDKQQNCFYCTCNKGTGNSHCVRRTIPCQTNMNCKKYHLPEDSCDRICLVLGTRTGKPSKVVNPSNLAFNGAFPKLGKFGKLKLTKDEAKVSTDDETNDA